MQELSIHTESFGAGVRLQLEGKLDGGAAYRLRDHISQVTTPVTLDCSRLDQLSDFGLGILAMAIMEMDREVQFVGLGLHSQRILQAFGLQQAA